MFAAYLSREKTHPILLITSARGTPEWVSPLVAQKLAVGMCDFTCCERNHKFGDKIVPCDRGITRDILEMLIQSKIEMLFKTGNIKLARMFTSMAHWWLRNSSTISSSTCTAIEALKRELHWNETNDGKTSPFDRCGFPILCYAVLGNHLTAVRSILSVYEKSIDLLLSWRVPSTGVIEVGVPGHGTCLGAAMTLASPDVVIVLLQAGANMYATDIMGNDGMMLAASFNRLDNIKTWFARNPHWEVDRKNERFGSTSLHIAVYVGQGNLDAVKYLIGKQEANIDQLNKSGSSTLVLACGNEDCDPQVVRYLLECGVDVNRQITSDTTKWRFVRGVSKLAVRFKMTRSKLMRRVAESGGLTALHYAARRGDMEIVELLLEHGAKRSIKNDLGREVLS